MIKDLLDRLCQLMPDTCTYEGSDYALTDQHNVVYHIPQNPVRFSDYLGSLQTVLQGAIAANNALYRIENDSAGRVHASIFYKDGFTVHQAVDELAAIALLKATIAWLEARAVTTQGQEVQDA